MTFVDRLLIIKLIDFVLAVFQIIKQMFDIFLHMALVFLQRQHIICTSVDGLLSNARLTAHGINDHNTSANFQHF